MAIPRRIINICFAEAAVGLSLPSPVCLARRVSGFSNGGPEIKQPSSLLSSPTEVTEGFRSVSRTASSCSSVFPHTSCTWDLRHFTEHQSCSRVRKCPESWCHIPNRTPRMANTESGGTLPTHEGEGTLFCQSCNKTPNYWQAQGFFWLLKESFSF